MLIEKDLAKAKEPLITNQNPVPERIGFFISNLFYSKEEITKIKGLAITPPILERISIGKVVEKNCNCK